VITKLSIGHFKAIASATIQLGPITVLVGPNDSGKSTILQVLMALSRCGDGARYNPEQLLECPPSMIATQGDTGVNIELTAEGSTVLASPQQHAFYQYTTKISPAHDLFVEEQIERGKTSLLSAAFGKAITTTVPRREGGYAWPGICTALSLAANDLRWKHGVPEAPNTEHAILNERFVSTLHDPQTRPMYIALATDLRSMLLRLDPRAIARPSPLGAKVLPDGSGLVGIVDELLTSGVGEEQIARVNDIIRRLSSHVKSVAAKLHPSGGKELHFALKSGAVIPASQMSDGIVLAAALVLISFWSGNRRLLIEEPENGLHPRQLKVVADTIRSISEEQGAQIILTTHSPLLLNHFAAEEVLLVTRDESGVHAQRMSDSRGLDDLASEMALGELWYNVGDHNLARPA
jgi:ABC-type branched-subunit amino acid transport system ATPase component